MAAFLDRCFLSLARGFWALFAAMPLPVARGFLQGLAGFLGRFDLRHRRVISENLTIAFPEWDARKRREVTNSTFSNWGRIAAEVAHAEELFDAQTEAAWQPARECIAELRERGRGVLILTAHTANFELMARHCGMAGLDLTLFHRRMNSPSVDGWVSEQRSAVGVSLLERGVALRVILKRLAGGGLVVAPLDQNQLPRRGIFVPMFGLPACTSTMLARLSLATGAPVIPIFAMWSGVRTVPRILDVIEATGEGSPSHGVVGRPAQIEALTAAYTRLIEDTVRLAPADWNWAHRRWKTRPPATPTAGT
jgi:KDO2-lipid IV(A) lauroyltransferase